MVRVHNSFRVKRKTRNTVICKNALQCEAGYHSNLNALIRSRQNNHTGTQTEIFEHFSIYESGLLIFKLLE